MDAGIRDYWPLSQGEWRTVAEDADATLRGPVGGESGRIGTLATLPAGARIGKYKIVAVLGQGSFGITYRARDTQLDRDVAIKEYLPTAFAVREPDSMVLPRSTHVAEDFRWGRDRFLAEARTLARFEKTPSIVNVHDFLEANGTAYMVMWLVSGETLEARLKRDGCLTQPALEQLLHPLLDGLEQVHAADFLHRDIKPANILVDDKGQPVLIDFGASRAALQGRTQALTAVYTPGYAAFEQFTSAKQGPWTDIYSLGATLYHCVTGAQPPSAIERLQDDVMVPAAAAGKGRYAASLLAAIDAALKLRAADRPQGIAAWRRTLPGAPPSMPADPAAVAPRRIDAGAAGRPGQQRARGRWPLRLAAATVILCLGGGGYLWWRGAQEAQAWRAQQQAEAQRVEDQAWAAAKTANTKPSLQGYLDRYPSGQHAGEARGMMAALDRTEDEAWSRAKATNTTPAYRTYSAAYPAGRFVAEAQKAIAELEADQQMWARAAATHTKDSYGEYLKAWPSGVRAVEARKTIADLEAYELEAARRAEDEAWAGAKAANTRPSLQNHLDKYPSGRHAGEARGMMAALDRAEDEAWSAAKSANTGSSLRVYLEQYPSGRYASEARDRAAALDRAEDEAWAGAKAASTRPSLQGYLDKHPSGRHAGEARSMMAALDRAEDEAWAAAKGANTGSSLRMYLEIYPSGRYALEARSRAAALDRAEDEAWTAATAANTRPSLQSYLDKYPSGKHAGEAQGMMAALDHAEDKAWAAARGMNTGSSLRVYLEKYPSGRYASEARGMMAALDRAEDEAWAAARGAKTGSLLRVYLEKYPSGRYASEARGMMAAFDRAEDEAWTGAKAKNTIASLRGYLERYPSGRYAADARSMIAALPQEPQPRDCPQCPEMVRIPSGSFLMGSPPGETDRDSDEGPQHQVTIGYAFSLGKYEVTRGEFGAFVQATGHRAEGDWRNPGFDQTERDPVVNVSWNDAKAYVAWLSRTTGKTYRLPSEAEWEYAARAGTTTARYWGEHHQDACRYANVDDAEHGCRDGYAKTAPVGKFQPNRFGLYDMLGNVWEWTEDCSNGSYAGAPVDGSSWQRGDCSRRVLRGGSLYGSPGLVRAANRIRGATGSHNSVGGFRVARTD